MKRAAAVALRKRASKRYMAYGVGGKDRDLLLRVHSCWEKDPEGATWPNARKCSYPRSKLSPSSFARSQGFIKNKESSSRTLTIRNFSDKNKKVVSYIGWGS